jgi:hypothetical protein
MRDMSGPINNMAGIGMIVCMVVGFTSIYEPTRETFCRGQYEYNPAFS